VNSLGVAFNAARGFADGKTGPAPRNAVSSSQRLAESAFQSSAGVVTAEVSMIALAGLVRSCLAMTEALKSG